MARLKSRKFWVALGTVAATIALGLGYELDAKLVVMLTSAESALYIVVQGIIDAIESKGRS